MSDFLLIVPDQLAGENFQNCTVVRGHDHWPKMEDVPSDARRTSPFVAATCSTNAGIVRKMLAELAMMRHHDRRVVFADDAVPGTLRNSFPDSLSSFIQRVLPCDLLCVSAAVALETPGRDSMLEVLLAGDVHTAALAVPPCLERFPAAGPRPVGSALGTSPARLAAALNSALSHTKLSESDKKCVTAGTLLLWDFLDESHTISQSMEGKGTPRTADYWHGIMHRREPDPGNAAYWFRRVGKHPAFMSLAANLDRWMLETGTPKYE
ncbi:MAG: hypothetical protein KDB01_13545, partial [Planctomycetaceae bacterium]|nr:hypothetical protein [Planctomycetaceae bacterium]